MESHAEKCGTFELTTAENTLKYLPKEQHIYTAKCGNCKKAIAVKAKELLSFERVFGAFDLPPACRTKVMEQSPLISENSGYETIQIYR